MHAGRTVVQALHFLIETERGRISSSNVGDRSTEEAGTGNIHNTYGGDNVADALPVGEEEQFVLLDGPAQRSCPLVVVGERARRAIQVVDVAVGIHGAACPPILGIAVKGVGAGLGDIVDLNTRLLAVLSAVGVGDHASFLHLVLTQHQVGGAGVVQVQVQVHLVFTVDGEHIGGRRQTGSLEVAITHAGVHVHAGRGLRDIGQVVARVGRVGDDGLAE